MKFAALKTISLALLVCAGLVSVASAEGPEFKNGPDGLRYKDLQLGQGPAAVTGQLASIHVVGWIDEKGARGREVFNSRIQRGLPVSFLIGTDRVMRAWNEGVIGMRPGGMRMLLVPPGLAYGARSIDGAVPENASLMMRIELVGLEDLPEP